MHSDSGEEPWYFENRQRKVAFDERAVRAFIGRLAKDLAGGREFAVVIGSDAALRGANRRFRGVSRATDVLSFPDGEDGRLGDLLISAFRAERQAAERGHGVEDELKLLALHGLLHLMGYDHEADEGEMGRVEKRLRRKYALPAGPIERAAA